MLRRRRLRRLMLAHLLRDLGSDVRTEQDGPRRQRNKRLEWYGGEPPAILSCIASAIDPLAGTSEKASGRLRMHQVQSSDAEEC